MASLSRLPYLIAHPRMATDNGFTPHLLVPPTSPAWSCRLDYVQDGRITLNVSYNAVQPSALDQDPIYFSARFGGRAFDTLGAQRRRARHLRPRKRDGILFGEPETAPTNQPRPARKLRVRAKRHGGRSWRVVK